MKSWLEFWNADTPIYANQRHKILHYQIVARDFSALIESPDAIILDYGCGEALSADRLAGACQKLILIDGAPMVRDKLTKRFADHPKISILSPDELRAVPDGSLDLIFMHSVAQYLTPEALETLLTSLRQKLKADGKLVLGDILPAGLSPLTDAMALLGFGWRGGFFIAAFFGLIRTALSDYRQIKAHLGLTAYTRDDLRMRLEKLGFSVERLAHNPGHNQARMGVMAIKKT
jgi:SAM-dependent methyltransferase